MPARSTSKTKASSKKPAVKAPAKKSVAKKKPAAAAKAKPTSRKKTASEPKTVAKTNAAPARGKRASKAAPPPGTITVGDTEYVLGEYGMLMTRDEYERMMARKTSG